AAAAAANVDWPASHIVRIAASIAPGLNDRLTPLVALSLGWILRLCHAAETRLLIIERADGPSSLVGFAQACADRGGPAVLVTPPATDRPDVHQALYASLVHDQPLDVVLRVVLSTTDRVLLVAGSDREEALRPSRFGRRSGSVRSSAASTVRRDRWITRWPTSRGTSRTDSNTSSTRERGSFPPPLRSDACAGSPAPRSAGRSTRRSRTAPPPRSGA